MKTGTAQASTLRLTNIPGRTRVQVAPPGATTMSFTLDGPAALLEKITWGARNGVLHIEGPAPEKAGGISISGGDITVRGGSGIVIGDGIVSEGIYNADTDRYRLQSLGFGSRARSHRVTHISSGSGDQVIVNGRVVAGPGSGEPDDAVNGSVELTVTVPESSGTEIGDATASTYAVASTRGTLDARITGAAVIRAGAVRGTRVDVTGSGRVTVASVLDSLRADITGSGCVDVEAGEVANLDLNITGSGRATFAGTAQNADLDVTGSGRIKVDTVTGRLNRDVTGSGRIDIRRQPQSSASDFWS